MRRVLAGLLVSLLLAACGSNLQAGTVVEKYHDGYHLDLILVPQTHCSPGSGTSPPSCFTTYVTLPVEDDEDFGIIIEGENDDGKTERRTLEFGVNDEEWWNTVHIGDHLGFSEEDGWTNYGPYA
jgi:hypothetical protein